LGIGQLGFGSGHAPEPIKPPAANPDFADRP
jgi:hypothetical protein